MILEVAIIVGGLTTLFVGLMILWPYIIALFCGVIIPAIRKVLGDTIADGVAKLIGWVDGTVSLARDKVATLYRQFKGRVLGITTTWKVEGAAAEETTETFLIPQDYGTDAEVVTSRRKIPYEKIPASLRQEMIRRGENSGVIDVNAALERKIEAKADAEGILLPA